MTTPITVTVVQPPPVVVQVLAPDVDPVDVEISTPPTIAVQVGDRRGLRGLPGTSGAGLTFAIGSPAATWTVTHNLGRFPIVQLIDNTGAEFDADVEFPDLNTVVITHATPRSGTVLVS